MRSAGVLAAFDRCLLVVGAIADPAIFAGAPEGPLSLNRYFDEAIAKGRLFGLKMQGSWITVGTPDAIPLAEAAVGRALAGAS